MELTTIDAIFSALNNETSANCELIVRNKSNGNAKKMDFSVLRNLFGVAKSSEQLLVDLGLPSGILWATRNIDVTRQNGFAESPYQYECSFFSWGNTEGKNPISNSAFDYNWGSDNEGPYANTPGAALTGNAGLGYDAARTNLGGPWRMPTTANFAELFNSSYTKYVDANGDEVTGTNKLVTVNGVVGIRLMSLINGKTIFFPCSGHGYGTSWNHRGTNGFYWSSSLYSATQGRYLFFNSGGVNPQYSSNRFIRRRGAAGSGSVTSFDPPSKTNPTFHFSDSCHQPLPKRQRARIGKMKVIYKRSNNDYCRNFQNRE